MGGENHGKTAKSGCGAEYSAEILWVSDLVEHDDHGSVRYRISQPQQVDNFEFGQRLDFESEPLMDGSSRQDSKKSLVIQHLDRQSLAQPWRSRRVNKRTRFLLMPGQHGEPIPSPIGIGECRHHRMPAI
jgi:hypothetical protein